MIISRTPYRISFFGGGTDYPQWYNQYGGQVISTTIDKYIYINCRYLPPFFEHRLRIVYSKEEVGNNVDEIKHPSARETLKYMNIENGLEIHYDGDLPGRSGLGSSSSFTVGLLNAISTFQGKRFTKDELAVKSIHIEQNLIKEVVGSQDQINAAYGGFNHINFYSNKKFKVDKINISKERQNSFEDKLMLFHTGYSRLAEDVAKSVVENIEINKIQLMKINSIVDSAIKIIKNGNMDDIGYLLDETWEQKKQLSKKVSNSFIQECYDAAKQAGALGGKITGAGGGGFLLLYAPIEKQKEIKKTLSKLLHVPFKFENNGSSIIFESETQKYIEEEKERNNSNNVFKLKYN